NATPNEGTVEQLSNHRLLNVLGPDSAWFYVPTRNEELKLGYDASLQEHKALAIQYKRFMPYAKKGGGRIEINGRQHRTLLRNFPRARSPYVFYAFCIQPSIAGLALLYRMGLGASITSDLYFIDIHSVPLFRGLS